MPFESRKGQGPVLQIAEGWTVNLDKDVFKAINERTDRTWPSTFFAPRLTGKGYFRDVYTVMNNWGLIMALSVMVISVLT